MQKTRRHGILSKTICLALIIMTVASLGLMSVGAAGNIRDEAYTFKFSPISTGSLKVAEVTRFRDKLDYTSSYMKCTSATTQQTYYDAWVIGTKIDSSGRLGPSIDCSNNGAYSRIFTAGATCYLPNLVKEKGLTDAAISGTYSSRTIGCTFKGVWSPDSV